MTVKDIAPGVISLMSRKTLVDFGCGCFPSLIAVGPNKTERKTCDEKSDIVRESHYVLLNVWAHLWQDWITKYIALLLDGTRI